MDREGEEREREKERGRERERERERREREREREGEEREKMAFHHSYIPITHVGPKTLNGIKPAHYLTQAWVK